jgi:hypothetical protein
MSALDEEMEAYNKANEDYIEQLRDKLDDADAMIEETLQQVLANADVVLSTMNEISAEYGVTLSDNVTNPWILGQNAAIAFKDQVVGDLSALTNEDGVVIPFGNTLKTTFETAFGAGTTASNTFYRTVSGNISELNRIVTEAATPTESQLKLPWDNTKNGPLNTFSGDVDKALGDAEKKAQERAEDMTDYLAGPYEAMMGDKGTLATFKQKVVDVHDDIVADARNTVTELNNAYAKVNLPSYTTPTDTGSGNSGNGVGDGGNGKTTMNESRVKALQEVLRTVFNAKINADGKWGSASKNALMNAQQVINNSGIQMKLNVDGIYGLETRRGIEAYIQKKIKDMKSLKTGSSVVGQGVFAYQQALKKLPMSLYASGTMGTKKNEWAITDEPQYGDELVLIPTKDGNLSYMRKGTSVIPADITENLVKWGQLSPDMSQMADGVHGVNVMTNVINNPNVDISFDSLLHIDNCSQDAVPQVKKLINEQLENFARKLNYNLKKVGAT